MKTNKLFLGLMVSGLALAGITQSCVSDEPFANGGSGRLRMQVILNSEITRAGNELADLADKCTIYLSGGNGQGLLYKYHGVNELPMEGVTLPSGNYVLEAWAGDSVPASFDKKFYRGYSNFQIQADSEHAEKLVCKIANVVVSVDQSTVVEDLMATWSVKVFNSTGALNFTPENAGDSTGYFMMSSRDIAYDSSNNIRTDQEGWTQYTNLYYTVTGTTPDGRSFSKTGLIGREIGGDTIVEHAHEYVLKFQYNPNYESLGGGLISIVVEDNPIIVEQVVGLYSAPSIKGQNFPIERQITGSANAFDSYVVKVAAFNDIKQLTIASKDHNAFGLPEEFNLMDLADNTVEDEIKSAGFTWEYTRSEDPTKVSKCFLYLDKALLNRLPERGDEYQLGITAKDGNGRVSQATVRIAVGAAAVIPDDEVEFNAINTQTAPMSILARKATISGSILEGASNPVLMYRAEKSSSWNAVAIKPTRATENFSMTLTDLEPATTYIFKAKTDTWEGKEYSFTTETPYEIPFGNMETWSIAKNNNSIKFPGSDYAENVQFWDSGNHGSATLSATLTQASNKMNHTSGGQYSAELKSQYVAFMGLVGKFAAGNLFVGRFGETIGTSGAYLTFGKPYNGSHPSALRVWANYSPGVVDYLANNCPYPFQKNSDYDHGQIYVAFATEPIAVNTGDSNASDGFPKQTFMQYDTDERIIGFGEKTWAGTSFGASGQLEQLDIPIEWRPGAETKQAKYIIIVCSASKYGDYFTGSKNSIMYVDDFELIY